MSDDPWCWLVDVPDMPSANVLLETLNSDAVTARIVADSVLLGEARACRVFVRQSQLHRARWLIRSPELSEAELTHLATGTRLQPEQEISTTRAGSSTWGDSSTKARGPRGDERG